jgi:hypothetical protein
LIYAAHRAPSGGNVNTKIVLLVNDQGTIQNLKLVSPGLESNPTLILVLCIKLSVAQEHSITLVDIGAAAENVALAATSIGLGVGFVKSFPKAAVAKLLHLPNDVSPELFIALGYPRSDQDKPPRALPTEVYYNTYGNPKHSNSQKNNPKPSYLFEIAAFILASARMCIDEPNRYGPKRLMDTLRRVLAIPKHVEGVSTDRFLSEILSTLEMRTEFQSSSAVLADHFKNFLDELLAKFGAEIEKRSSV